MIAILYTEQLLHATFYFHIGADVGYRNLKNEILPSITIYVVRLSINVMISNIAFL